MMATSRAEAKNLGATRYNTGKPCIRGHVAERFASTGQCSACLADHGLAWRKSNPEKVQSMQRSWRDRQPKRSPKTSVSKTNRERNRKYRLKRMGFPNANLDIRCIPMSPGVQWAIYYEAKREVIAKTQLAYRERNRDALKAAWAEWYTKNRVSQIEKAVMRRQKVLDATPPWLTSEDRLKISAIYFESVQLAKVTGIQHQVDHIVPIAGKTVCGLHVPWNLRAIPALDNIRKSNKLLAA